MINLEKIKRIAEDIISDVEWVNDIEYLNDSFLNNTHTEAEHLGVQRGLNMLIRHLEETNQEHKPNALDEEDSKLIKALSLAVENDFITMSQAFKIIRNL